MIKRISPWTGNDYKQSCPDGWGSISACRFVLESTCLFVRISGLYKSHVQVRKMSTHLSWWDPAVFRQRCILCVWRLIGEVFNSALWRSTGGVINRPLQATQLNSSRNVASLFSDFGPGSPLNFTVTSLRVIRELTADQRKVSAPNHWVIIHPQVGQTHSNLSFNNGEIKSSTVVFVIWIFLPTVFMTTMN